MADTQKLTIKIGANITEYQKKIEQLNKRTKRLQERFSDIAKTGGKFLAGFTAAGGLAVNEFRKFETALVGVQKTTDLTNTELEAFVKANQALNDEIPVSTNELLKLGQVAGQLGVRGVGNLLAFEEVAAKLAVSTNLAGEEGVTAIVRILNVTGSGIGKIREFGAAITALGNQFEANESEILNATNELARAGSAYDLSAKDALALGAALKSVGVEAEIGASGVGQALFKIEKAIRSETGPAFEFLQMVTGQTGEQLKKTFAEDSFAVFKQFIEGLSRVQKSGGSVNEVLEQFDLRGQRVARGLIPLIKRVDKLSKAQKISNQEFQNARALDVEAEKAFATLDSALSLLTNSIADVATNIGSRLAPAFTVLVRGATSFFQAIEKNDVLLGFITRVGAVGAVVAGAITAYGAWNLATIKLGIVSKAIIPILQGITFSIRGLVGATGIGLIILVLAELVADFDGSVRRIKTLWDGLVMSITSSAKFLAKILKAVFTLDVDAIKKAFKDAIIEQVKAGETALASQEDLIKKEQAAQRDNANEQKKIVKEKNEDKKK